MLKTEKINNVIVAKFKDIDRFTALISEPVKDDLKNLFVNEGTDLALNLNEIKFVDSTGFGVFLSILKAANNSKGRFKICCVNKDVMELFKLLQLHSVFEIFDTQEECVNSFS